MTTKEGKTITHLDVGALSPTQASYWPTTDRVQAFLLPPHATCHPWCILQPPGTSGNTRMTAWPSRETSPKTLKIKPNAHVYKMLQNHQYLLHPRSAADVTQWKSNYQWVTYWITGFCSAPEKFKQEKWEKMDRAQMDQLSYPLSGTMATARQFCLISDRIISVLPSRVHFLGISVSCLT